MIKFAIGSLFLFFLIACNNVEVKKSAVQTGTSSLPKSPVKIYSKDIKDTFYIFVSTPDDKTKKYPVIYLPDANLNFDIMAATFKHYSEVNMLPEAVLIGIGYKNIFELDSLRNRDLTFPTAMAKYEMPISGGAQKFQNFIQTDLFKYVETNYPVDTSKRVLMGHSLSGYFTLFAMHQNLLHKNNAFLAYIAASPSLHYNDYYLLKELDKFEMPKQTAPKVFVAYGGLEDEEEDLLKCEAVLQQLNKSLSEKNKIPHKSEIYSNLAHMSSSFPSFVKGLQWNFNMEEE